MTGSIAPCPTTAERIGPSGSGLKALEQLHRIARRILEQDLPAADAGDDLVAELRPVAAQCAHRVVEVRDFARKPMPAPGLLAAPVGTRRRPTAAAAGLGRLH